MKPITIIRIEHKDSGLGIFQAKGKTGKKDTFRERLNLFEELSLKRLSNRHQNKFPSPYRDLGRYAEKEEFCAFKSIEQVQQWITPREIKILVNNGFKILELKVTKYTVGKYQVLFYKDSITKSRDITHIF